ncbi:peptide-methionine (S)-S-oxide reductase [Micromonospora sp. NPDC049836]|uniref:peptide-methionine (S)-S-oxide reductase n=1 Tax=Micromonospora sp. NPDC049836 TaxID=3364274 RepID=UPI003797DD7C
MDRRGFAGPASPNKGRAAGIRSALGVVSTRVGCSGGDVPNATYRNHGTHAESIEVVYDTEQTDFRALLVFCSRSSGGRGAALRERVCRPRWGG